MTEIEDITAAINRLTSELGCCRRHAEIMRSVVSKQRIALDEAERAQRAAEDRFDAVSEELKQWQNRQAC